MLIRATPLNIKASETDPEGLHKIAGDNEIKEFGPSNTNIPPLPFFVVSHYDTTGKLIAIGYEPIFSYETPIKLVSVK